MKKCVMTRTQLICPKYEQGESIEEMLRRLTANKEPIPNNVPPIYTPMEDGVLPDTDIRTDRFEIAIAANDKYTASERAKAAAKGTEETEPETKEE